MFPFSFLDQILFGHFLEVHEWRNIDAWEVTTIQGIPGAGTLQCVSQRVWWPSIFRLALIAIPVVLVSLFLLFDTALHTLWAEAAAAGAFYICVGLFPLFLAGIWLLFGILESAHIIQGWPGRLPHMVAVFTRGIAWTDQERVQFLSWAEIKTDTMKGVFWIIETQTGRQVKFHHSLRRTQIGREILIATGKLANPGDVIVCPHCGKEIAKDSSRCLFCLEPVSTETRCPACGAYVVAKDAAFCRQCGTKLQLTGPNRNKLQS
jgi:hypothetical protein